ncbi:MAG TPA: carboxypeptidase regulatory-like domain-containing protein [Phycisphaerae bacterium]|nr:carboxypeptidase regulatory-like domain-containing protein [Phycisphaerae bacterium]
MAPQAMSRSAVDAMQQADTGDARPAYALADSAWMARPDAPARSSEGLHLPALEEMAKSGGVADVSGPRPEVAAELRAPRGAYTPAASGSSWDELVALAPSGRPDMGRPRPEDSVAMLPAGAERADSSARERRFALPAKDWGQELRDHPIGRSLPGLRVPTETAPIENPYEQRSSERRMVIVEREGGSEETERAVALALRWLAAHQSADGRWDADGFDAGCGRCGGETNVEVDVALTGLSLLCFLAADHTHTESGPYRDTVERGLVWLADGQSSDGDLRQGETMYSQGIATIALSEAYGMTGDAALADPVRRAIAFVDAARNRSIGGWRYDPGQVGDTSVLGWQVMALKSAQLAGVEVPADAFAAARDWLELVGGRASGTPRGMYAYQPGHRANAAMTAEGMFVQQLLGRRRDEARMRASAKIIAENLPDWESHANTYYWYYATLALFQHRGEEWRNWNEALTEELLAHQEKEGAAAGSWDPVGEWAPIGGRVYQTAICTLMLEVYYRYLPLYGMEEPVDAIGTIRGRVVEAGTERPVGGATVRLDVPDRRAVLATTDGRGEYVLVAPNVPDFFALSASADGYVPEAVNVATIALAGKTMTLDFELEPADARVIAVEPEPEVHHLGNDQFTGVVNSQFQRSAEGSVYEAEFEVSGRQLSGSSETATIVLLAKGVQCPHRIRVNGRLLGTRLDESPGDGSFGELTVPFPSALLEAGINNLRIQAVRCQGDLDDFEFVNVRIRLSP